MNKRKKKQPPLYSVGTWCVVRNAFTVQDGLSVPSLNVPLWTVRQVLRELRLMGYTAHRFGGRDAWPYDSDPMVVVERTDGQQEVEILRKWGMGIKVAAKEAVA